MSEISPLHGFIDLLLNNIDACEQTCTVLEEKGILPDSSNTHDNRKMKLVPNRLIISSIFLILNSLRGHLHWKIAQTVICLILTTQFPT